MPFVTYSGSGTALTVSDKIEPVLFDVNTGLDLQINDRAALKLIGRLQLGDEIASYGGSAKLSWNF